MKQTKLWILAAILLCGTVTFMTVCKGGAKQAEGENNDSTAVTDVDKIKEVCSVRREQEDYQRQLRPVAGREVYQRHLRRP